MDRIKVVLLCHFSSEEIRNHLPLTSMKLFNLYQRLRGHAPLYYKDYAVWNTNTISEFEKMNDIEVHVVAPHQGLLKWKYEFKNNNITYHFFRPDYLFPLNYLTAKICRKSHNKYLRSRKIVKCFIEKIEPDIVNLVGAENPYYSICGLDIENIPLFISCQTVYSNPERYVLSGKIDKRTWEIEQKLFKKTCYFSCTNKVYRDLIKQYVPNAIVFPMIWQDAPFPPISKKEKKYDFAFFAVNVTSKKGIDSAIEAMGLVRQKEEGVTLLVVGNISPDYKERIQQRITELHLEKNIIFHDFFPLQVEMFNYVSQARFALLPVKMDYISGTILQAFEMGMPVVTHITTGTPTLNEDGEAVLLSKVGDYQKMADDMIRLMHDEQLSTSLSENGHKYMKKRREQSSVGARQRVDQYKVILRHSRYQISIPEKMLSFD